MINYPDSTGLTLIYSFTSDHVYPVPTASFMTEISLGVVGAIQTWCSNSDLDNTEYP